jgi:VWFA-related protein
MLKPARFLFLVAITSSISLMPLTASAQQSMEPASPQSDVSPGPDQTPRQATAVLEVNANVVLVDVVITDKGNAVHDLDRSRFHIFEDGHEQHITYFDESKPALPASVATQLTCLKQTSPRIVSNVPCAPSTGAVNVLLLDALNTPLVNQGDINQQVLKYLSRMPAGTSLAVFLLNNHGRLQMLSGFTMDAGQLVRVVQSAAMTPDTSVALDIGEAAAIRANADREVAAGEFGALVAARERQGAADLVAQYSGQQVQLSLLALRQLALYLDAVPGRKNLIWFSGSFPITLEPDPMSSNPALGVRSLRDANEYGEQLHDTIRLLSVARVAVYPVYALGPMSTPSLQASYSIPGKSGLGSIEVGMDDERTMGQSRANQDSMKQLADQTGGHYFDTNGLTEAMASAIKNGASFYTIGYVPTSEEQDGKFHTLKMRLDGASYALSYRRGYMADPDGPSSGRSSTRAMQSSVVDGAPPATQIQFMARVLSSTDPVFKSVKLPTGNGGAMATDLIQPVQHLIVDLAIDPQGLVFETTPEGMYRTPLEFAVVAYDALGKRVNYVDQGFLLSLKSGQYARMVAEKIRIPHRVAFDLPEGTFNMRIVVMEPSKSRIGSVELPVASAAN